MKTLKVIAFSVSSVLAGGPQLKLLRHLYFFLPVANLDHPDANYLFQIFYGSFNDDRFRVRTLLFRDKLLNSL